VQFLGGGERGRERERTRNGDKNRKIGEILRVVVIERGRVRELSLLKRETWEVRVQHTRGERKKEKQNVRRELVISIVEDPAKMPEVERREILKVFDHTLLY